MGPFQPEIWFEKFRWWTVHFSLLCLGFEKQPLLHIASGVAEKLIEEQRNRQHEKEASHLRLLPPLNSQRHSQMRSLIHWGLWFFWIIKVSVAWMVTCCCSCFFRKLQISAGREDRGFRNMNGGLWYPSENAGKLPTIKHTQKKAIQVWLKKGYKGLISWLTSMNWYQTQSITR